MHPFQHNATTAPHRHRIATCNNDDAIQLQCAIIVYSLDRGIDVLVGYTEAAKSWYLFCIDRSLTLWESYVLINAMI